ncbi:Zinc finger, C2H2 type [Popillia japonica]|uniref:Zinc finger, C2H2 type n=1 Tax=Popillia japonica TaxID=7064 RepID=A0AAW1JDE6_POPJA
MGPDFPEFSGTPDLDRAVVSGSSAQSTAAASKGAIPKIRRPGGPVPALAGTKGRAASTSTSHGTKFSPGALQPATSTLNAVTGDFTPLFVLSFLLVPCSPPPLL